jgi:hypothetical protein
MLKTACPLGRKLALRWAALMSAGAFQSARLASAYKARKEVSAWGWRSQNSRKVRKAMMRMGHFSTLPIWQ